MYKKIKIPFIIAPLLYLAQWGFFIFYHSQFQLLKIGVATGTIAFFIYLLEKNYPVISDNYRTSMFVFFSTMIPIFTNFVQPFLLLAFISLFFLLVNSPNSLKISGYLGIITGIVLLINSYIGLYTAVLPLIFIFTLGVKKFNSFLIFILSILEIFVLYFLSGYIWGLQFHQQQCFEYNNMKIFYLFLIFSPVFTFLSMRDFFKFKINKRKHISAVNTIILFSLVFFYITHYTIFLGIIPFLWALVSYMQEKKADKDLLLKLTAILFSVAYATTVYA